MIPKYRIEFVFFLCSYPTSAQYSCMVDAVLNKWPQLKREFGNDYDAKCLWKHKLWTHFKNTRKRTPQIPEILCRKRKRPEEQEIPKVFPKKSKSLCSSWGVPNFLPPYPEGEDSTTIVEHVKRIQRASKISKTQQEADMLSTLMDLTFSHRRKEIVLDFARVQHVLELYPVLSEEGEVSILYFL